MDFTQLGIFEGVVEVDGTGVGTIGGDIVELDAVMVGCVMAELEGTSEFEE